MVARIFLCHASEDKAQVREVYHRLKALGFEPWLDEMDILPGQDWEYEIEQALETSEFVIVFLSTHSVGKIGYVQREFRRTLYYAEEMPQSFIHTIPVKLDDCAVPSRFRRHQWANLYEAGAFERIVRALQHGLQQREKPLPKPLTHDPSSAQPETVPSPILESPPEKLLAKVKVVFFDLGDTLVHVSSISGNLTWTPESQKIIRQLQNRHVRLGIISNVGPMTRQELLARLPADFDIKAFEEELIILSSEVNLEKPNMAIFELAIKRANVGSKECIYISESLSEINAARQAGMKILQYQSFEQALLRSL